MKGTSIVLMIITVLTKLFGLAREKALAHFFGTTFIADVFLIAFQIPMTFSNVIQGAMISSFIPAYDEIERTNGEENANIFTAKLAGHVFVLSFLVSIVGIIFTKGLIKLMAPGFEGEVFDMAVFITRAGLLSISAVAVYSVFKSFLQLRGRFVVSVIHAIVMNVIVIFSMALAKKLGINYLAAGVFAGFTFQFIIFHPYIRKSGYKEKIKFDFKDENVKNTLNKVGPILIATSVIELNFIISKAVASGMFQGAVSTLNFAYKLQSFVTGIVVTSVITAIYPKISKYASLSNYKELRRETSEGLSLMALLMVPASFALFILAKPVVELLFKGGAFSERDVLNTASVLSIYATAIVGIGFREMVLRLYYAMQNTKMPVINSIVVVIINWILSIVLGNIMGIKGLALATSLSFWIGALQLTYSYSKTYGALFSKKFVINFCKILIGSIVMAAGTYFAFNFLTGKFSSNLSLLITILIAGILYFLMLFILKTEELKEIKALLIRKD